MDPIKCTFADLADTHSRIMEKGQELAEAMGLPWPDCIQQELDDKDCEEYHRRIDDGRS